jgi:RHS repeat-associated protein
MKTYLLPVLWTLLFHFSLTAQNVHYGECFELNSTLNASQSHEYTANSHIDLNPGFDSNPNAHQSTTLQLDPYGIHPPTAGVTGGSNTSSTGVVGAIGGTVDVGHMGAAVYTIPIEIPAGINGMQPGLAITYNSQAGNGLLGWGWDLTGVSAITRAGTTLYHDGYMSGADFDDDRFYLDGQRLMVVSGSYGADGAEYKTEVDGMSKVVSYTCDTTNGPAKFKVWTANGLVLEYGGTSESRIGLHQRNDVCLWLLNRVEDRNGNYMTYHYNRGGASYQMTRIKYTYNDAVRTDPPYEVSFLYDDRDDKEQAFVGNNSLKQNKLLKEINVKYDNDSVLWHYYFNYDSSTGLGTKDAYHRLTSIRFKCGNQSYNPTTITWNQSLDDTNTATLKVDGNIFHYDYSTHDHLDLGGIKFTGDFNGDGYTDLVTTWYRDSRKMAYFYLNSSGRSGGLWELTRIDSLYIDDNVDWVYTGDFNGDGLTDILFLNRERGSYYDFVTFNTYLTQENPDGTVSFIPCSSPQSTAYWIWHDKGIAMEMGDFTGERRDSFVFQTVEDDKHTYKRYHIYYDDVMGRMMQDDIGGINPNAEIIQAADFNGDGIAELWYFKTDQSVTEGKIVKLDQNKNLVEVNGNVLTRYHKVFPGDFNGDGKADFLSFARDGNGGGTWQINLSKEGCLFWPQFDITDEMGIGDPGDHGYSMQSTYLQSYQYKMVGVADFNGDGKSDIATVKNDGVVHDSLIILYAPFGAQGCAYRQAIQKSQTGMGTALDYNAVIGNFLGRENVSVCWHDDLFSVTPLSDRYTVAGITDGMGDTTSFQYKYLMPDLQDLNWDDYYLMNNTLENRSEGIFSVSLPIKAVSKISGYNAGGGTVSINYKFEGAVVHNKGKGFLGFTKRTVTTTNNSRIQARTVTYGDLAMLRPFPMIVPQCDSVFDQDGNPVTCAQYNYVPFVNNRDANQKVFLPLMNRETIWTWDLDHHLFQKKTCVMNSYSSDIPGSQNHYNNAVKQTVRWRGVTSNGNAFVQQHYEFRTREETAYETDILSSWTLNRPFNVTCTTSRTGGYEDVCHRVAYTYDPDNPALVSSVLNLPNNGSHPDDPLAVKADYLYDSFGHVINETLKAPNDNNLPDRTTTYQYSADYGYRFLTGKTSPMGYTSSYAYDEYYGFVTSETDCNGRTTRYVRDPLGITQWTYYPDSTRTCVATRWNGNSEYYTWSKSSGEGVNRSYYGKKGQLKRTSTYGINGRIVLTSTQYDSFGRVQKESLPYFEGDAVIWTNYTYDDYDRLTKIVKPDGTKEETTYDGLTTTYLTRPVSGTTHETTVCSNVMGWTVSSTEKLDDNAENTVTYGHYADGALAWAKVNGQTGMCDSLRYDHRRNRVYLRDPDYGATSSHYNAFGELVSETDPKGNVATNTYDLLGRNTTRTVTNGGSTLESTAWTYNESTGCKGLLSSVTHDNQTISYVYDNQLRVSNVTNTIGNESYSRSYTYDSLSRVLTETYPSGVSVKYGYKSNGFLHDITDLHTGVMLWRLEGVNAAGQPTETVFGNGIVTRNTYDELTGRLTGIHSTGPSGNATIQRLTYVHDDFGNLLSRKDYRLNNGNGITETFTYDRLNRLKNVTLNGVQKGQTLYDSYGRITSKSADGQTVFSTDANSYNMADKPHALKSATVPEGLFPNTAQSITYTHFDKVSGIAEGNHSLGYTYGYDHQRISMEEHVGNTTRAKRYVGNCEYVTETTGNTNVSRWITYLSGPTGLFAAVETENNTRTIHYILKDNLGSWTTITDGDGVVEQRLSYDAWGNLRNPNTWSGSFSGTPMFDRGFTGHEHLYDFGLINMNGRMYDPVMSGFLSVDQYVQSPGNSQNFNRYAYCLNNPLRYVDPDGEEFLTSAIIIGSLLVGAYSGGVLTNGGEYNPIKWDWSSSNTYDGMLLGGVFGGLSGFASVSIAGMGFAFCNTASIAASSLFYSGGMYFTGKLTNFNYDISISIGIASLNLSKGEFRYLFKKGNSVFENIGYGLGAITNMSDIYRYAIWGRLSKQQRYDKLYNWAANNHGENNMEYKPQLFDEAGNPVNVEGTYNWETDKIRITDVALSNDFGYAKSTYLHELNHRLDMTPMKRLLIVNKALRNIDWDYYDAACDWHNQFYAACDARSYAVELCNASKNGLSLSQYNSILQNYNYYSQLSGVSIQIPRYSLWTLIKSTLLP